MLPTKYSIALKTTLLVDANYMLHRVMHLNALRKMTNGDVCTGPLFGYLSAMTTARELMGYVPYRIILVWDGGHSTRRTTMYEEYKHDRKRDAEPGFYELFNQTREMVKEMMGYLNVGSIQLRGREGDDVIAYMASTLLPSLGSEHVAIMTDDKDYFQLVSDTVTLVRPMQREVVSLSTFTAATGMPSPRYALYLKCLQGGKDGIPKIKGIGKGTATKMLDTLQEAGTLVDNPFIVASNLQTLATGHKSRYIKRFLEGGVSTFIQNYHLSDMSLEEFTPDDISTMTSAYVSTSDHPDARAVRKMLKRVQFRSILSNLESFLYTYSGYSLYAE